MMTFHEIQMEINRAEAKLVRQQHAVTQTTKLIDGLKQLQQLGEKKSPAK